MNSRSVFLAPFRFTIYLLIITSLLVLQYPRPVQSISLSRLCGSFGHSCFGANWGKRSSSDETSTKYITVDLDVNDNIDDGDIRPIPAAINDDVFEKLRMILLRRRLRQSFGLE